LLPERHPHTEVNVRNLSYPLLVVGLAVACALAGCGEQDQIRHYQAPKPEKVSPLASAGKEKVRLLGAIFPRDGGAWVFKFSGPEATIVKHEETFDKVVQSVRFGDKADPPPISWTTPAGWKHELNKGLRYATIKPEAKDDSSEITLSQLQGEKAAAVEDNVKRWCGQLGLGEPTGAELAQYCTPVEIEGIKGTLVRMTGTGSGKGPMMPPFAKGKMPPPDMGKLPPPRSVPLTYTKPEGWVESKREFSVASFRTAEGGVEITSSPLAGAAGGLDANINRWRGQVGLPDATPDQLSRDIREINLAGTKASFIDLIGPESAPRRERIVGIVLPRGNMTWFFKMRGPADQVERQLTAFQAFVESVKFNN